MSWHRGHCHLEVKFDDFEHVKYFQPGKIFGFKHFVEAEVGPYRANEIKVNEQTSVIFQIFSKHGRRVLSFTPHDSETEALLGRKVVFARNTHFLICKRIEIPSENAIHIYLREVQLGLQENVVIWLDDNMLSQIVPSHFIRES